MNDKVLEVIRRAQSFTVRSAEGQVEEVIPTWTEERLCAEIESIFAAALAEQDAEISRLNAILDEVEQALINNDLRKTAKAVADERLKQTPPDEKKREPLDL